jgi:hypothetical protein
MIQYMANKRCSLSPDTFGDFCLNELIHYHQGPASREFEWLLTQVGTPPLTSLGARGKTEALWKSHLLR